MAIGQMNFSPTDDANRIYAIKAAELRSIPNTPEGKDKLQSLVNSAFGSLALIEIDKRNRAEMMKMAQNQQGMTGTMADASIAEMMRNRMMERMAGDERMGIPNVVNQFEQRMANEGVESAEVADTGEGMAGGGIVAFQQGGKAQMESDRAALIDTARKLGYSAADIATLIPRAIGGAFNAAVIRPARAVTGEEIPFIPDVVDTSEVKEGDYSSMTPFYDKYVRGKKTATERGIPAAQDTDYPDESRRGSASYLKGASDRVPSAKAEAETAPSKTGIGALALPKVETDPEKLIAAEDALLKKMGLGAYGEKVRESMGKRKGEAEERFQKGIGSETFLEAAEAAGGGGKRLTGLGALAAAVGGAGKAATRLRREKDTALDKVTEGEERLLLAEDLYKRGRVSDATKMAKAAEQQIFDNTLKLRTLDLTEQKINATIAAAKSRAGGMRIPQSIIVQLEKDRSLLADALSSGQIKPEEYQKRMADLEKRISSYIMLGGMQIGTRERGSDED
jgi:hypothetical protein